MKKNSKETSENQADVTNISKDSRIDKMIYLSWIGNRLGAKQNRFQINSFSLALFSFMLFLPSFVKFITLDILSATNSIILIFSLFLLFLEIRWAILTIIPRIKFTYPIDIIDKPIKKNRLSYYVAEYHKMYYNKIAILKLTSKELLKHSIILILCWVFLFIVISDVKARIMLSIAFLNLILYKLTSSFIKKYMLKFYRYPESVKDIQNIYVKNLIKHLILKDNEKSDVKD